MPYSEGKCNFPTSQVRLNLLSGVGLCRVVLLHRECGDIVRKAQVERIQRTNDRWRILERYVLLCNQSIT